ncbi:MAG: SMC-Scp complex subunit ScpB [Candidatus Colwellbacteria bacterium]|nr:SMC-Scp complex subunit ScpB [Candidatus Colwellbacteria bacterium]
MEENKGLEELEALLFLYGEPVKFKKLADTLGRKENQIREELELLKQNLDQGERGLTLIIYDDRVQLTTKPELQPLIQKVVEAEMDTGLTPASLETLTIIAYLGPCSRALVEHIRGVNSSFILRSLLIRGLVERNPDPKHPNTYFYQVTFDFLRHIGLDTLEKLPDYEKYRELVKSYLGQDEASEARGN